MNQMAYKFWCLEIELGYLPHESGTVKKQKAKKIEIVNQNHEFFDFALYISLDLALNAGYGYIIFFAKKVSKKIREF